jgi:transcriptional regulator with XRE-family HTH domain
MVESEIIAAFSAKLKSLRLGKGLTMEELAALSGVSVATISKIEKHQQKPAFETVLRVARALQINFVQMVEEESTPPRNTWRAGCLRNLTPRLNMMASFTNTLSIPEN